MKTAKNPEWYLHDRALARADRKFAEIGETLMPGAVAGTSPVELARYVARRMSELSAAHRAALMIRISLAVSDLGATVDELDASRASVESELRRLNGHSRAALVYARNSAAARARPARR